MATQAEFIDALAKAAEITKAEADRLARAYAAVAVAQAKGGFAALPDLGRFKSVTRPARKALWDVARLYVGAGRLARVRPGDLVGAIANELQLDASVVGAIQIQDKFSIVEVPDEIADDIIDALRNTTIKGKRVIVRRDRS